MSDASAARILIPLTKPEFLAAVNAVDAWVDLNASAFNLAIPQPARGVLTARQKAELLYRVALKRYQVSP